MEDTAHQIIIRSKLNSFPGHALLAALSVANLNSRDPKLYQPMVNLVGLLERHGADVDSLATEIAFSDSEQYRTSSPLCQAAKVEYKLLQYF